MTAPPAMRSYQISEQGHVNAALLGARITKPALILNGIVACICAGMICYAGGVTDAIAAIILITTLIILVRETARLIYVPFRARREYKTYKRLKHNGQIELTPEGLRFINENSNVLLRWDQFLSWRYNARTTIIYTAPRIFIQLPERLTAESFDLTAVRRYLRQIIGKPT